MKVSGVDVASNTRNGSTSLARRSYKRTHAAWDYVEKLAGYNIISYRLRREM